MVVMLVMVMAMAVVVMVAGMVVMVMIMRMKVMARMSGMDIYAASIPARILSNTAQIFSNPEQTSKIF